jgi:hypothetical protein
MKKKYTNEKAKNLRVLKCGDSLDKRHSTSCPVLQFHAVTRFLCALLLSLAPFIVVVTPCKTPAAEAEAFQDSVANAAEHIQRLACTPTLTARISGGHIGLKTAGFISYQETACQTSHKIFNHCRKTTFYTL